MFKFFLNHFILHNTQFRLIGVDLVGQNSSKIDHTLYVRPLSEYELLVKSALQVESLDNTHNNFTLPKNITRGKQKKLRDYKQKHYAANAGKRTTIPAHVEDDLPIIPSREEDVLQLLSERFKKEILNNIKEKNRKYESMIEWGLVYNSN